MKGLLAFLLVLLGTTGINWAQNIHTCTEMPAAALNFQFAKRQIPQAASRAVGYKPKFGLHWAKGSTIRIKLIGGSTFVRDRVRHYASQWTNHANLNFQFINSGRADIRVTFVENGSSWSVIGKQALQVDQSQATMNFGWLNDRTPEYEFKRTILHEFGHALGLLHEHQNPSGGIPWDEQAVYDHYWRTQGWDQRTTYQNVIQRASRNATQFSQYDPYSIMHYPIPSSLTEGSYQVGMNQALSPTDIAYIREMYPGRTYRPDNSGTNTGGNRPSEVIVEKPKPSNERFIVSVSNRLGNGQVSEKIDLYLGGEKYTFNLNANGRKEKTFRFRMKRGKYSYRLASASTYQLTRQVWNGWRYVRRKVNKTIYGSGSGTLNITGGGALTLYGDYDKKTDRMTVYLGAVRSTNDGLANVQQTDGITCSRED
ncbi:MAG: M12 family metallopeptidase [Bacteroidota bacterium]